MLSFFEAAPVAGTKKRVEICTSGDLDTKKEMYIESDWSFDEFLRSAGERLNTLACYAFSNGVEIDDCMLLGDRDVVVLSHDRSSRHSPLLVPASSTVHDIENPSYVPSVVGHYLVGRLLGRGGFGEVRLGTHQLTNQTVALKFAVKADITSLADADRLTKEFQVLASLNHRNIIKILSREELPNHVVLAFELMKGGDLHGYLLGRGPAAADAALDNADARLVFGQLVAGMSYAHSLRVIHRDLKVRSG